MRGWRDGKKVNHGNGKCQVYTSPAPHDPI